MSERKVIQKLKSLTGCTYVRLTNRCNTAILASLHAAKQILEEKEIIPDVTIQDQGGWITYKQYAEKLKLPVHKVKTEAGLIKHMDHEKIFLLAEPAGYYVKQDLIKEIRKNSKFLMLDVSGSLGKSYIKKYKADVVVGSFSHGKPVDFGYGGFFATNKRKLLNLAKDHLKPFAKDNYDELYDKLKNLKSKYKYYDKIRKEIINDLKYFKVLYPKKDGINIIVACNNEMELIAIKNYCEKNNLPYTECPRYIRYNGLGISIEIKRL